MSDYVTQEKFDKACGVINKKIDDVKDNHLLSIYGLISDLDKRVGNLRWFIIGVGVGLGILQIVS